jgi:uncharacterized protein (TIGR03083 family)
MIADPIAIEHIVPFGHEAAMDIAETEWNRLLALIDALRPEDWSCQTDCTDWDVRSMLGHILGALEMQADPDERMRQVKAAAATAAQAGGLRLDAMTALQVSEHAALTTDELRRALHEAAPRGLAARRAATREQRDAPYDPALPGESGWTFGYLFDVIHTRDPWIHRVDISRATGRDMEVDAGHDGRIIADVVADWGRHHGRPFTLRLTGPAGGVFTAATGGDEFELDAVEFCRVLSGREPGTGLLATRVTF